MSQPVNPGRGCPVCFKSGRECLCGGVNREGLTWDEWARAAGLERPPLETTLPFPEYEAWKQGEDPTEYRAARGMYPVSTKVYSGQDMVGQAEDEEGFCACGRVRSECDGSRKGCPTGAEGRFLKALKEPDPPMTNWNWNKASRAVVAQGQHKGCVVWFVGGHLSQEIEEAGLYALDELGLDDAPKGISIWEGVYLWREGWNPAGGYDEGGDSSPKGSFRAPTKEEWRDIENGKAPWNEDDWMSSGGSKEPEKPGTAKRPLGNKLSQKR